MDYSYYLKKYIPDKTRLTEYGFIADGRQLVLKKPLRQNGLYAVVRIADTGMDVRVIDSAFDDDFIPFGVKASQCPEKREVDALLGDIVATCFDSIDARENITKYMYDTYGTVCERPWDTYPDHCTFKTAGSKKWYAIIMSIKRKSLGLDGDADIDVINVKLSSQKIPALIDGEHYFAAYHMNKKNWLTVLLDADTDIAALKALIAESYALTEKCAR